MSIRVSRISSIRNLEHKWNELLKYCDNKTIFQTFEWNDCWWEHFGKKSDELFLLVLYSEEMLIAIFPLKRSIISSKSKEEQKILTFIGYPEADYLDAIIHRDYREEVFREFTQWLSENCLEWDVLWLPNINEDSVSAALLDKYSSKYQLSSFINYRSVPCFSIDLKNSIEEYFSELEPHIRKNVKLEIDTITHSGKLDIIEAAYDDMVEFQRNGDHSREWIGDRELFQNNDVMNFHKALSQRLERNLNICFLCLDERKIAVSYSYNYEGRLYFLLSGIDERYKNFSPGTILLIKLIGNAIQKKLIKYDLLSGMEEYKYNFVKQLTYNNSCLVTHDVITMRNYLAKEKDNRTKTMKYKLLFDLRNSDTGSVRPVHLPEEKLKILVLSPHFDDEILCCGGILAKHHMRGDQCTIIYFTNGMSSQYSGLPPESLVHKRKEEAKRAINVIGDFNTCFFNQPDGFLRLSEEIIGKLTEILKEQRYDRIFVPNPEDRYNDHYITGRILLEALNGIQYEPEILFYEFTYPLKTPNVCFELNELAETKRKAMEVHETQLNYVDYVRIMQLLNNLRGQSAGCGECEMFQMVKGNELKNFYNF